MKGIGQVSRMPVFGATWLLLIGLGGCALGAPGAHPSPPDDREGGGVADVDRGEVAPGGEIGIVFEREFTRSFGYRMESWDGDEWELAYWVTPPFESKQERGEWATADEGLGIPDLGISGLGPDFVPVPEPAPEGWYRLCTQPPRQTCTGTFQVVGE